jgi:YD repeat-containing protein
MKSEPLFSSVIMAASILPISARMTWDWSTYLPCADGRCYWTGYQDAKGNSLHIERAANLDLERVTWQDGQAITFQSDVQHRILDATDSRGNHVSYDYGGDGCLAQVHHADGQTTLYDTQNTA